MISGWYDFTNVFSFLKTFSSVSSQLTFGIKIIFHKFNFIIHWFVLTHFQYFHLFSFEVEKKLGQLAEKRKFTRSHYRILFIISHSHSHYHLSYRYHHLSLPPPVQYNDNETVQLQGFFRSDLFPFPKNFSKFA